MGKKSTPAAPVAPDPVKTVEAQAGVNKDAAIAQANLNRIDQVTPQGSIKYSQIGTNEDGTPQYQQTQTYSPDQQKLYDQQNQVSAGLGGLAVNNIDKVAQTQAKDFNFNGMTPQTTSVNGGAIQGGLDYSKLAALPGGGTFGASAQKASDTAYAAAAARLDPQFKQSDSDLTSRLANSGISVGSDAYNREVDNAGRTKNDAYGMAQNNAYAQGLAAQAQEYGQDLSTRQQGVSETDAQGAFANNAQNQTYNQAAGNAALGNSGRQQEIQEASYLRNLPLNDIASLLGTGAGVQNPTFQPVAQVGVAAPDYQGAVQGKFNNQMTLYTQAQQQKAAGLGSVFGLAGSLGSAAIMSDRRLKHSIKRVGTLANGLATYVFSYIGSTAKQFGVMAQEVLDVVPDAVITTDGGYMAVNYSKVWHGR